MASPHARGRGAHYDLSPAPHGLSERNYSVDDSFKQRQKGTCQRQLDVADTSLNVCLHAHGESLVSSFNEVILL